MARLPGVISVCLSLAVSSLGSQYEAASANALRELGNKVAIRAQIREAENLTGSLPDSVVIYQVIPRASKKHEIGQLLATGGLSEEQTFKGSNRGVFGTPGTKYYGSLEKSHTLTIVPAQGWVRYERGDAIDDKGDKTAVGPSEEETLKRGMEIAGILGFDSGDFAKTHDGTRIDYRFNKTERSSLNNPPRVVAREVFLPRAINGYRVVTGHLYGGIWVGFGIKGILHRIELTARACEPLGTVALNSVSGQRERLNAVNVYVVLPSEDVIAALKDKDAILNISDVELVYFEDAPEKFQTVIPPILRWEANLKFKGKNESIVFFSSIQIQEPSASLRRDNDGGGRIPREPRRN